MTKNHENETGWYRWLHHYGDGRKKWLYAAWHIVGTGANEDTEGHIEWSLLNGYGWDKTLGVQVGRNGSESDLGLNIHIPWLGSAYARLRSPWTARFRIERESGDPNWAHARHYSLKLNHAGMWISGGWGELDGHWSSDDPWYRSFKLSASNVLGKVRSEKVVEETGETVVPMPEGTYEATWERHHYTRCHVRWPGTWLDKLKGDTTSNSTVSLNVPGGIPEMGKGTAAYNCGMDGTYGLSGPFATVEQAVGGIVESVLRDRRKYGGPHDLPRAMTVGEAEAHVMAERTYDCCE